MEIFTALLEEALDAFLNNDLETGKLLLRDYVNATIGFEALGAELHKSPKSLMRMLSDEGNPRAGNLFAMVSHLKAHEGVSFTVHASTGPRKGHLRYTRLAHTARRVGISLRKLNRYPAFRKWFLEA